MSLVGKKVPWWGSCTGIAIIVDKLEHNYFEHFYKIMFQSSSGSTLIIDIYFTKYDLIQIKRIN